MINFLDSITIKGFKSIASVEDLRLRPVNVLIGPNGCGKSNFIGAFAFMHEIREGRLQEYVTQSGGAEKILHFGSKTTPELSFHLKFSDSINEYSLKLLSSSEDSLFPSSETVSFWDKSRYKEPYGERLSPQARRLEAGISDPNLDGVAQYVRARLGQWRLYHVHDTSASSPMRKTAKVDDNEFLRPDGSNLAAFLYLLRERHPDSYGMIKRSVQRVAPFFEDFRLQPRKLASSDIQLEWNHRNSGQYFHSSSLSDGTLRFIVLATLFLQPDSLRPSLILVDEPELGLHPAAIELLGAMIRQTSAITQVIVSTQSSLLLDQFQPEDVLIAERSKGATVFHREDPERLKTWLEDYSLGQLWEKNELGGRPSRD